IFEKTKEGKAWLGFAHSELQREMQYQVLADGVDFEKSTWYHGFATEIFLTAYNLFRAKKLKTGKNFEHRLAKMLEFLHLLTRKDGSLVLIGDSDSGRLLRFWPCASFEDVLYNRRKLYCFPRKGSYLFDKSGFAIYRDSKILLTFFSGPTGTLETGGHTHNACLAFTLDIKSNPVFIDPGTFIYTGNPEMRNLFRSTAYHNTVKIDNAEQNYFDEKHLFKLFDKTKAEITFAGNVRGAFAVAGRHHGYADRQVTHERLISINPKKRLVSILDNFEGRGIHSLEWNFHAADKVKKIPGGFIVGKAKLHSPLPGSVNASWYSNDFGQKQPGNKITFSQRVLMPKLFKFAIEY
ncbi:alginate lyase family protein, partial [Candidatus Micrarchaeota archaeon]|nr:alginate lyase family protein [Candidatus Micrarchaeota archaeon]